MVKQLKIQNFTDVVYHNLLNKNQVNCNIHDKKKQKDLFQDQVIRDQGRLFIKSKQINIEWVKFFIVGLIFVGFLCYQHKKFNFKSIVDKKLFNYVEQNSEIVLPIVIALQSEEPEFISLSSSKTYFQYYDTLVKTSWVGKNGAILVYDYNQNKVVDDGSEIILTTWATGSTSDFDAIQKRFDTNKDIIFNYQDEEFEKFMIWEDLNQNGVSEPEEVMKLSEARIIAIDFRNMTQADSNLLKKGVLQTATIHWADGYTTVAYDAMFIFSSSSKQEFFTNSKQTSNDINHGKEIAKKFEINIQNFKGDFQVAFRTKNFMIVWENYEGIFSQLFDLAGKKLRSQFKVDTGYGCQPTIASHQNGFIVAWILFRNYEWHIFVKLFDFKGKELGGQFQVNNNNPIYKRQCIKIMSQEHDFMVVWYLISKDYNQKSFYGQLFYMDGEKKGDEIDFNTSLKSYLYYAIVNYGCKFIMIWESELQKKINGQLFNFNGQKEGEQFYTYLFYRSQDQQLSIASYEGGLIVSWCNLNYDIYGQLFDINGTKQGEVFEVYTSINGHNLKNEIVVLKSCFIVVWQSHEPQRNYFFGQIFDFNGKKQGNQIKIIQLTKNIDVINFSIVRQVDTFTVIWSYAKDDRIYGKTYRELSECLDFYQDMPVNKKKNRVEFPEQEDSLLLDPQIVFSELPQCGRLLNGLDNELMLNIGYKITDIFYEPCQSVGSQEVVKYMYMFPEINYQGDICQITFVITPAQHCFKALKLIMRSSGDISTTTEDIELEFTYSSGKKLDCGLFKFDINNANGDFKILNIAMPCTDGEYVDVRFIERDNCNDDTNLYSFKCEIDRQPRYKIEINPDNTIYTKQYCEGFSHSQSLCADGEVDGEAKIPFSEGVKVKGQVGGKFCQEYSWNHDSCSGKDVSEKISLYYFGYQVTEGACDVDFSKLKSEKCYHQRSQVGPQCESSDKYSNQDNLKYSLFALFVIAMLAY